MVVRRPIDAADFDGTVFVEWLNVSGGLDASPDWTYAHVELIRSGAAWVGVSAQTVGIVGGGNALGAALALKNADPERYAALSHPGDDYSYDMYSQAGSRSWAESATAPRRPRARAGARHRRVAVGLPAHHLRERGGARRPTSTTAT